MFFPFDTSDSIERFAEAVYAKREDVATKLSVLVALDEQSSQLREMSTQLDKFFSLDDPVRRRAVSHPMFYVWMRTVIAAVNGAEVDPALVPLDIDYLARHSQRSYQHEADVHPVVRWSIPPTHIFTEPFAPEHRDPDRDGTYEQAIETALRRADWKVPGFADAFGLLVRNVLVLEDVDFRSCSADRYQGLLILTTSDQSLIELEESLVHEFTHQVLYLLDYWDPVFLDKDDRAELTLPWSGSVRNYFGFVHASYVYLVLRDYYQRSIETADYDLEFCVERRDAIQSGLDRAAPTLLGHLDKLTPAGRTFVEGLVRNIPVTEAAN